MLTFSHRWRWLPALLAVLIMFGAAVAPAAPLQAADREAEPVLRLEAIPGLTVVPGETLAYKILLRNRGDGELDYARVVLPYDPALLTPLDTEFQTSEDYVESLEPGRMVIFFGNLGDGAARFAVIYMRVSEYAPQGTVITGMLGYDWEDKHGNYDLNKRSNAAPVVVGDVNRTSETVWVAVDPGQAPAGTEFGFFSDRFVPDEQVQPLLRMPDGTLKHLGSDARATVNGEGRVWLNLDSNGLAPGAYEYVLEGKRSELVGAVPFVVE
jgi:hypothetical protein